MSKRHNLQITLRKTHEAVVCVDEALRCAPTSQEFFLRKAATDLRLAEQHIEWEIDKLPEDMVHGVTCEKVQHRAVDGYGHEPGFDGEFVDDGVRYCGRCHHCF
jgi:hypothetical protein